MTGQRGQTTPEATARGVVVGVDGSASARAAVLWGAAAASRRNLDLHLVEVLPGPADSGIPGRARALLSRARQTASAAFPELVVTTDTLTGRVGPTLVDHAEEAALVVLGSNGPGGPVPLSLGSVVGAVTRQCTCPVVLVPPAARSQAPPGGAPVLVALEDGPDGERALAFAADVASRRGAPLTALVSTGGADAGPPSEPDSLVAVREEYPGLVVRCRAISTSPADALLAEDDRAGLIVVPSQSRRSSREHPTAGWTGHFLPVLSACPVAVVSAHTRTASGSSPIR